MPSRSLVEGIMKLPRRKFLHLAAGAAALPAMPRAASALDYPTRPIHLIVGFPPEAVRTLSRGSSVNHYRIGSVSQSSSKIGQVPGPILPLRR